MTCPPAGPTGVTVAPPPPTGGAGGTVLVWDPLVRIFHWSLVISVSLAWLIADPRSVHRALGYAVAGLLVARIVWGIVGSPQARFRSFVVGPRRTLAYLRAILRGREARHLGHNPAGAAMIVALIALLGAISVSGYMMGMDRYFGQVWVETLHKSLVDALLVLVALHIGGVVLASLRHRENLVAAMITGHKPVDDAAHPENR